MQTRRMDNEQEHLVKTAAAILVALARPVDIDKCSIPMVVFSRRAAYREQLKNAGASANIHAMCVLAVVGDQGSGEEFTSEKNITGQKRVRWDPSLPALADEGGKRHQSVE